LAMLSFYRLGKLREVFLHKIVLFYSARLQLCYLCSRR